MDILIYESHAFSETKLPFIFHNQMVARSTLRISNWHLNIEILYCTGGSGRVLSDANVIPFEKGDIVVINSNCIHTITSDSFVEYQCLIVDSKFCEENDIYTDKLVFTERLHDKEMAGLFDNINKCYGIEDDYRIPQIRASVLSFIIALCRGYISTEKHTESKPKSRITENVKEAMTYIQSHLNEAITLDSLSAAIGISKYHLAREFKKITHLTIISYINLLRCEYSKRLLKTTDYKISKICDLCGFDNFSYYSRTFRKHYGMLPSEYRKSQNFKIK